MSSHLARKDSALSTGRHFVLHRIHSTSFESSPSVIPFLLLPLIFPSIRVFSNKSGEGQRSLKLHQKKKKLMGGPHATRLHLEPVANHRTGFSGESTEALTFIFCMCSRRSIAVN